MKFTRYPDYTYVGYQESFTAKYEELVEVFGEPDFINEAAVDYSGFPYISCEWSMKFADGTIATIYCYGTKNLIEESNWFIGGYDKYAVKRVKELLK